MKIHVYDELNNTIGNFDSYADFAKRMPTEDLARF